MLSMMFVLFEKSKNFWDGKISVQEKPLRIKIRNISGDELIEEVK